MAEIFLAIQQGVGGFERLVVFKRLAGPFADSILREARVAAKLAHPNIVTTIDVGEDEQGPYLVLEYLSGETLSFVTRELRSRSDRLPLPIACHVAASVAAALDFAHRRTLPDGSPWPVVHSDVTPSNVMCGYDGQVKLLDFGVARLAEDEAQAGLFVGKPAYLSPEHVGEGTVGPQSDVFQLGIVTWEMLTGHRLFLNNVSALHDVVHRPIEPPSAWAPDVPEAVDRLVMWALERDPKLRCPSAREFGRALETFAPQVASPLAERDLAGFMASAFARSHQQRRDTERLVRDQPDSASGQLDIVPSVTSSVPEAVVPLVVPSRPRKSFRVLVAFVLAFSAGLAVVFFAYGQFRRGPEASAKADDLPILQGPPPAPATPRARVAPPPSPRPAATRPAPPPPAVPVPQPAPAPPPPAPVRQGSDNLDPWGSP